MRGPSLRPIEPADHTRVLDLNSRNVDLLAPMDTDRLTQLLGWTHRADVLVSNDEIAGFVFTFAPGTAYDSENYRWFSGIFGGDFYYLDRIVIDDGFRRRGLAGFVYDALEMEAAPYRRMVLEVNVEPANEPSLAFHRARGYVELGRLGQEGKRVALLAKPVD